MLPELIVQQNPKDKIENSPQKFATGSGVAEFL
jgi:hypothetical protein